MYNLILKCSKKSFVSACGDDDVYYQTLSKFKYHPYTKLLIDEKIELYNYSKLHQQLHNLVIDNVDGVIPAMYDYALGYRNHKKVKQTIPLPIDLSTINEEENKIKNSIFDLTTKVCKANSIITEVIIL